MKKAQIKMGETIAVLVIFFFLLIFGFAFYVKVQEKFFEEQHSKQLNLKALQITQKASYLPELQCSVQNIQFDNCFDVHKINSFYSIIRNNMTLIGDYYEIFGFSKIYIQEIYPGNDTYMIYNNTLQNATGNRQIVSLESRVPISLFNGKKNTWAIGVLNAKYTAIK